MSLRSHRHAGRPANGIPRVLEPYEDPVGRRIERHAAVALHEDAKGRRLARVNLNRHAWRGSDEARAGGRIRLADRKRDGSGR